jgi:serine protease Do
MFEADSPAARNGIRKGDILVGLSKWKPFPPTTSPGLEPVDAQRQDALKFYLIRGSETLFGHLQLAFK